MKIFVLSDGEFQTPAYDHLHRFVLSYVQKAGHEIEEFTLVQGALAYCMGCFGCWTKTPGECIIQDGIAKINRTTIQSDGVIYLSPVVFGQFSANMKVAIDRSLPNMLPFFETRPDGSTMHPPRYPSYPKTVMLGYGDHLTRAEEDLFTRVTKNHRSQVEVLLWHGQEEEMDQALHQIDWHRTGGHL